MFHLAQRLFADKMLSLRHALKPAHADWAGTRIWRTVRPLRGAYLHLLHRVHHLAGTGTDMQTIVYHLPMENSLISILPDHFFEDLMAVGAVGVVADVEKTGVHFTIRP